MTAIVLVAVGVIAGVVYCHARHALAARIETVDRVPKRRLPGLCVNCGEMGVDSNLHCVTCGSDAIWLPASELPKTPSYAAVGKSLDKIERHAAIAARVRAKHSTPMSSERVQ